MATFQIHQDIENIPPRNRGVGKTKIPLSKIYIPKKRHNESRLALQPVNSKQEPEVKRRKLNNVKTNSKISVKITQQINKVIDAKIKLVQKSFEEKLDLDCTTLVESRNKIELIKEISHLNAKDGFLYCTEYIEEFWNHLSEKEATEQRPNANYMRKQTHLNSNMRSVLIDWLICVAAEYKMNEQTVHLGVYFVDKFLSHMSVIREKFQLLGAAAMLLASKIEEIYPPDVKEWVFLTENTFTVRQVLRMEQLLLKVLQFKVQPPTMLVFIQHFCVTHELDKETMYLAMFFSELVLLDGGEYLNYLPSQLASAAIALARFTLSKRTPWPSKFRTFSGYTLKQLSPVVQRQNQSFRDSPTKPQSVVNKYQSDKYHKVALLQPRALTLDDFNEDEE